MLLSQWWWFLSLMLGDEVTGQSVPSPLQGSTESLAIASPQPQVPPE